MLFFLYEIVPLLTNFFECLDLGLLLSIFLLIELLLLLKLSKFSALKVVNLTWDNNLLERSFP